MTQRSQAAVIIFIFITFGIYGIYWLAKTRGELVQRGADIPTTWLMIVPIANIYYLWKYAVGSGQVTKDGLGDAGTFLLMWFLMPIGACIVQGYYNKTA